MSAKFSAYEVTIRREVEYVVVVDVQARSFEEARETAASVVANANANYWRNGKVINQTSCARKL